MTLQIRWKYRKGDEISSCYELRLGELTPKWPGQRFGVMGVFYIFIVMMVTRLCKFSRFVEVYKKIFWKFYFKILHPASFSHGATEEMSQYQKWLHYSYFYLLETLNHIIESLLELWKLEAGHLARILSINLIFDIILFVLVSFAFRSDFLLANCFPLIWSMYFSETK